MSPRKSHHKLLAVAATALLTGAVFAPGANAQSTAQANLTGGSLQFMSTPTNVNFGAVTLNGADQDVPGTQTFDVRDARGTGNGWNITATSTTFAAGGETLPASSVTLQAAPTSACIAGSTCTVPSGGAISYPYSLPAGTVAPTATKMFAAGSGTGLGEQRLSASWRLTVPGSARAGNYTSTWTFSLVSGP